MSYASIADLQARFPNRDLVQLTQEDPTLTTVNTSALQAALDDASDEIDSYLEARFALPFISAPPRLLRLCCDIAIYNLNALRPIHDLKDAETRYKTACQYLTEVSEGKRTLGLEIGGLEPTDPTNPAVVFVNSGGTGSSIDGDGGIVTGGCCGDPALPHRVFSRCSLRVL